MEIRYLGFEQRQNSRVFRFEVRVKGLPNRQLAVTADMSVFRTHSVGIQEGPTLSSNKLTADLERGCEEEHELTSADVRAYATSKSLAEAQRAAARKNPRRRPPAAPAEAHQTSAWRSFGI
jgi:hypothetical protein